MLVVGQKDHRVLPVRSVAYSIDDLRGDEFAGANIPRRMFVSLESAEGSYKHRSRRSVHLARQERGVYQRYLGQGAVGRIGEKIVGGWVVRRDNNIIGKLPDMGRKVGQMVAAEDRRGRQILGVVQPGDSRRVEQIEDRSGDRLVAVTVVDDEGVGGVDARRENLAGRGVAE